MFKRWGRTYQSPRVFFRKGLGTGGVRGVQLDLVGDEKREKEGAAFDQFDGGEAPEEDAFPLGDAQRDGVDGFGRDHLAELRGGQAGRELHVGVCVSACEGREVRCTWVCEYM